MTMHDNGRRREADWNPARIRSLGCWQGGALVREYERPARRAPPANDNRPITNFADENICAGRRSEPDAA